MIKCNVKVCGIVTRAASTKTTNDGKSFVAFAIAVDVPATKGDQIPIYISVAADNADVNALTQGRRVAIDGVLKVRGAAEKSSRSASEVSRKNMYFNLSATSIELDPVAEAGISGEMEFRGTLCKDIVTPTDKKGNKYLRFSAYSTDKVGEEFFSVFVRFVQFTEAMEAFMVPKGKIEAKGDLRVTTFNGNIDLSCKISEIKQWEKTPF